MSTEQITRVINGHEVTGDEDQLRWFEENHLGIRRPSPGGVMILKLGRDYIIQGAPERLVSVMLHRQAQLINEKGLLTGNMALVTYAAYWRQIFVFRPNGEQPWVRSLDEIPATLVPLFRRVLLGIGVPPELLAEAGYTKLEYPQSGYPWLVEVSVNERGLWISPNPYAYSFHRLPGTVRYLVEEVVIRLGYHFDALNELLDEFGVNPDVSWFWESMAFESVGLEVRSTADALRWLTLNLISTTNYEHMNDLAAVTDTEGRLVLTGTLGQCLAIVRARLHSGDVAPGQVHLSYDPLNASLCVSAYEKNPWHLGLGVRQFGLWGRILSMILPPLGVPSAIVVKTAGAQPAWILSSDLLRAEVVNGFFLLQTTNGEVIWKHYLGNVIPPDMRNGFTKIVLSAAGLTFRKKGGRIAQI